MSDDIFSAPRSAPQAPYAGFGIRAMAQLVDGLIMSILAEPIRLLFTDSADPGSIGQFIGLLISLIYFGYLPTTGWQGTPGKRLFNLKIETLDGQVINSLTSLKRLSINLVVQIVLVMAPNFDPSAGDIPPEALAAMVFALLTVGVDGVLIFIRPDRRALHDLIAGTCVRRYTPVED